MQISKLLVKALSLAIFGLSALCSQTFTDVSSLLMPDFPIGSVSGQRGASAADFNNDGLVDIYHANFQNPGRLYLNQGNDGFIDVLPDIGIDEGTNMWGAAFGDYNQDGYLDIIFEDLSAQSKLYRNNRNFTFTEINDSANVLVNTLAQGAAWGDFNRDGNLDLFIVNDHGPNQLFKNLNRETFLDISISANVQTYGNSYGVSWGDINNDHYPDAYIATCHPSSPLRSINHLLLNNRDETFTDIGQVAGVADSLAGWSVLMFDYDHDFDIDIFCTNSFHDPRPGFNRLYRNEGDSTFINASFQAGVAGGILEDSFGAAEADFDNDGWTDIYIADLNHRDRLYHNNGDGTFIDVALAAGIANNEHRAVAVADFNNDGWIDIFTAGQQHNILMYNNGGSNHWIRITLRGISDNYYGVDARVEIYTDTLKQLQEIRAGDSFCSQSHNLTAHFGLGQNTSIDSIIVRWPGGTVDRIANIQQVDQQITIVEGIGINHRPTTFNLVTPADGDTLHDSDPGIQFSWRPASDPDSEPLIYNFYLSGNDLNSGATYDTVITGISDTTMFLSSNLIPANYSYLWTVDVSDGLLLTASTNAWKFLFQQQTTAITTQGLNVPGKFDLKQNYPNPFNPTTTINYQIPFQSAVEIAIYNILGEKIRVLADENQAAGFYTLQWDGKSQSGDQAPAGIYIYRIRAEGFTKSRKMLLMK